MTEHILLIFSLMFVFFVVVVLALVWAVKSGQFQRLNEGAKSIFDSDEPTGVPTDNFPKGSSKRYSK